LRYFLHISYLGTRYCGWQQQPNAPTVQEELNKALRTIFRDPMLETLGCGRTDTGVHAASFYVHADLPESKDWKQVIYQVNALLPDDIALNDILEVPANAHARFDATLREYKYYLHFRKDPFVKQQSTYLSCVPDLDLMNSGAKRLLGTHDFTSFAKLHSDNLTNICTVSVSRWETTEHGYVFTIAANRFLRNMVRAVVGTLVELGRGKITIDDLEKIIENKNRSLAGTSMPPQGLFLTGIEYPYI
jgi:tRNA pseudouridine38-40 synthase